MAKANLLVVYLVLESEAGRVDEEQNERGDKEKRGWYEVGNAGQGDRRKSRKGDQARVDIEWRTAGLNRIVALIHKDQSMARGGHVHAPDKKAVRTPGAR